MTLTEAILAGLLGLSSSWALVQAVKLGVAHNIVFAAAGLVTVSILGIVGVLGGKDIRVIIVLAMTGILMSGKKQ